jgi:hypothetical protein
MKTLLAGLCTVLVHTALLGSPAAFAQDVGVTTYSGPTPTLKRTTFEIKPIETLLSSVPGLASIGASLETYLGKGFAATVQGTYLDVNLSGAQRQIIEDETNRPTVDNGYGYSAGAGLRFYEDVIGNSWYGGGAIDYREIHADWDYKDERLNSVQFAVIPSLSAGYRWVWQNGFLIRLGVGAGLPSVPTQNISTAPAMTEGEDKLTELLDQKFVAQADFGIGLMF